MKRAAGLPAPALLAAALAAALFAAAGLGVSGCEGTSSGVDNPGVTELSVDFRDAGGAAMRVSGDLDVFAKDQNPALYPAPLATVKVLNSAQTNLSSEDFARIQSANDGDPPTKRSAAAAPGKGGSPVAFNVVFRGDARLGTLAFGLVYDPKKRAFLRSGAELARLDLRPKPVIRYAARLERAAVHGDLGRVFIPGTPYLASLADSDFVLEQLPEGVFDLRLLAGDGSIYAVKESLDTRQSRTYTAALTPLGHIDPNDTMAKPVNFKVEAVGPPEAFANAPAPFDARLVGVEPAAGRASYLWRQLDSAAPGPVVFKNAAAKGTEITFPAAWVYTLEVTATIGVTTARDTLVQVVRDAPAPPRPRIITPRPGDTLVAQTSYHLAWEMPAAGTATVEVSCGAGTEAWETIAGHVPGIAGMSYCAWTPPDSLAPSPSCLLRVRQEVGGIPDSLVAVSERPFAILPAGTVVGPPKPPPVPPGDTLPKP